MLCAFLVDLCLLKFTEKICKKRRAGTLREITAAGAASAKRAQFTRGGAAHGGDAYSAEASGAHGAGVIYAQAARVYRAALRARTVALPVRAQLVRRRARVYGAARRSDARIKFVPPRELCGGT